MKRTYLVLIITLLVIGFAAVSTIIYINGKTSIGTNLEDYNIYFSEAYLDDVERLDIISKDKQKITFNTKVLKDIGDSEILEYDVTNASKQYDAKVSVICEPIKSEYYEMEHVFDHEIIKARTYETGYITIKLKKVSIEEQNLEFTCILKVDALEKTELNTSKVQTRCEYDEGHEWNFEYTGSEQTFEVPCAATYKIELWGATGGVAEKKGGLGELVASAPGAYTSGEIALQTNKKLYVYVGGEGNPHDGETEGGYNGGGSTTKSNNLKSGASGGGATDIRLLNGDWNNFDSLKSRIMVAAGSGGGSQFFPYGSGGGLNGWDAYETSHEYYKYGGKGGTQTRGGLLPTWCTSPCLGVTSNGTAGSFGIGGNGGHSVDNTIGGGGCGGGGGYYGGSGSSGLNSGSFPGGGGSSFISGHQGCDAINENSLENAIQHTGEPNHYSGLIFSNTVMIDGAGYSWTNVKGSYVGLPNKTNSDSATVDTNNGYAKITLVNIG